NDVAVFTEFRNSPGYSVAIESINLALKKLSEYGIAPKEVFKIPTSGKNFRNWLMSIEFYNELIEYSKNDFYDKKEHPENAKLKWFPDNLVELNKDQDNINENINKEPPPESDQQPADAPS
ncbi:MAG: hypothetical protein ACTSRK_17525, partial [Promethearchaeota archaeon]